MRGYRVQCGNPACMAIETVSMNTSAHSSGDDDIQTARRAQTKFEKLGWKIGKREKEDRCPKCVSPTATVIHMPPPQEQSPRADLMQSTTPVNEIVPQPEPPPADPPKPKGSAGQLAPGGRAITRADKRVIITKLEDVYGSEETGYQSGWSDQRVAHDLNCPAGWVAQVREENFGPGDNPEIRAMRDEVRAAVAEMKDKHAEIQRHVAGAEHWMKGMKDLQADASRLLSKGVQLENKLNALLRR